MRTQEVRLNYQEAIQLIRVGHYEEALELLYGVDKARPNVKNVLFPMAVCCEKLGHIEESLGYCDRLIRDYDHEKAKEIKVRLLSSIPFPEEAEAPRASAPESVRPDTNEFSSAVDSADASELDDASEVTESDSPGEGQEEPSMEADTAPSEKTPEVTAGEEEATPARHKSPLWLVLIIALIAAAITAGLIHYFLLRSYWPVF